MAVNIVTDGPGETTTDDLFKGKKVVLFGLPGAFTPTCSAKHLPGFVENADAIKAKGVDSIICLAVNDIAVLGAWADDQNSRDSVIMLADGSAELTKAMGLDFDGSEICFGTRSNRFSMIVEDGVVKVLNLEEGPRSFDVSDAETLLGHL